MFWKKEKNRAISIFLSEKKKFYEPKQIQNSCIMLHNNSKSIMYKNQTIPLLKIVDVQCTLQCTVYYIKFNLYKQLLYTELILLHSENMKIINLVFKDRSLLLLHYIITGLKNGVDLKFLITYFYSLTKLKRFYSF